MQPLTFDQLYALPTTVDLMTAARALRIGRTLAYQLAKAGEFPCPIIRVGTGYHVPTAGLLEALGITSSWLPEARESAKESDGL